VIPELLMLALGFAPSWQGQNTSGQSLYHPASPEFLALILICLVWTL